MNTKKSYLLNNANKIFKNFFPESKISDFWDISGGSTATTIGVNLINPDNTNSKFILRAFILKDFAKYAPKK